MNTKFHPQLPSDLIPQQIDGFSVERIPCCYLLKHRDSDLVVSVNATGALIWQLCDGENTVGEIIEALQEGYPDAAADMEKDVFRTLDTLKEEGVITFR